MPIRLAKLMLLVPSVAFVLIPTTRSVGPFPVWLHIRLHIRIRICKLKTPLSASLFVLMPTFFVSILIPMSAILVPVLMLLATAFRSVMHFIPNLLF